MVSQLRKLISCALTLSLFLMNVHPLCALPVDFENDAHIVISKKKKEPQTEWEDSPKISVTGSMAETLNPFDLAGDIGHKVVNFILKPSLKLYILLLIIASKGTKGEDIFQINQNPIASHPPSFLVGLANGRVLSGWPNNWNGTWSYAGRSFLPDGTDFNDEFQFNQNTTGRWARPFMRSLQDGSILAMWQGKQNNVWSVYNRLLSLDEIFVRDESTSSQSSAVVKNNPFFQQLKNKDVLLLWDSSELGSSNIYGEILFSNGTLKARFEFNQNRTANNVQPHALQSDDGNILILYECGKSICGSSFDENIVPIATDFVISETQTGDNNSPFLLKSVFNDVLAGWQHVKTRGAVGRVRSLFSNGTVKGIEQTFTHDPAAHYSSISGATLDSGNQFIVFHTSRGGVNRVWGRILSSVGTPLSDEFLVIGNMTGTHILPRITNLYNSSQKAFVSWANASTGSWKILGRSYDEAEILALLSPTPTSEERVYITSQTAGFMSDQQTSSIAFSNNGSILRSSTQPETTEGTQSSRVMRTSSHQDSWLSWGRWVLIGGAVFVCSKLLGVGFYLYSKRGSQDLHSQEQGLELGDGGAYQPFQGEFKEVGNEGFIESGNDQANMSDDNDNIPLGGRSPTVLYERLPSQSEPYSTAGAPATLSYVVSPDGDGNYGTLAVKDPSNYESTDSPLTH